MLKITYLFKIMKYIFKKKVHKKLNLVRQENDLANSSQRLAILEILN